MEGRVAGDVIAAKHALRERLRARRDALPAPARAAWALHMASWADALLAGGAPGTVGAYWPLRSEADPRPLAQALAARGVLLALPVVVGVDLVFRNWTSGMVLEPAGFGTVAPGPSAIEVSPDLMLVPLLGFDARGHRLGWGKGYYDRYLARRGATCRAVGLAFACQQLAEIPAEAHDRRLDGILTERGYQAC